MKFRYIIFTLALAVFLSAALFLTAQNRNEDPLRLAIMEEHFIGEGYLDALKKVPRSRFFPEDLEPFTREDRPLPDKLAGITPAPSTILTILEKLDVAQGSSLLIIGRGGGYSAALAAALGANTILVEESEAAANYRILFEEFGLSLELIEGGWEEWLEEWLNEGRAGRTDEEGDAAEFDAGFDAIFIHAGVDTFPASISSLLHPEGRAAVPLNGTAGLQNCVIVKQSANGFSLEQLAETTFAPLQEPFATF
jgi:protein-L-isoaspartate(D-aspartate) O-methyltransferase